MKYFTADLHLRHGRIIKYCNRPFNSQAEMDNTIIDNIISCIQEEDELYILGDLTLSDHTNAIKNLLDNVKCNVHLVLGNHDRIKPFSYLNAGFSSVHTSLELTIKKEKETKEVVCVHDPALIQKGMVTSDTVLVLSGHVHNHWKNLKTNNGIIFLNVGVDVREFTPVSEEDLFHEFVCLD